MVDTDQEDTYSEAETVARREAALKRALAMPHKPHKPTGKQGRPEDRPGRSRKKPVKQPR